MGWGELGGDGVEFGYLFCFGASFSSGCSALAAPLVLLLLLPALADASCSSSRRSVLRRLLLRLLMLGTWLVALRHPVHLALGGGRGVGCGAWVLGRGSWLCAIPSICMHHSTESKVEGGGSLRTTTSPLANRVGLVA